MRLSERVDPVLWLSTHVSGARHGAPDLWWLPGVVVVTWIFWGVGESTFRWVFFRVAGLGFVGLRR
jgi:hypothetical protein